MGEISKDDVRDIISGDKTNEALRKARREAKNLRDRLQAVEAERDQYKGDFAKLSDEFKGYSESSVKQELDQLKQSLNRQKHQTALEAAAKKLKVRSEALMDLEKIIALNTDGEPDEKSLESALKDAIKTRPYLLEPEVPLAAGPGLDRGDTGIPGEFVVKSSQMRDPAWMMRNQHKISDAVKSGTYRLFEDVLPKSGA